MNMIEVESSNVYRVGYSEKILYVEFRSGYVYEYQNVESEVFENFLNSNSKGSFVHTHLKNKYPFKRIN